jgi:hypothetical protein
MKKPSLFFSKKFKLLCIPLVCFGLMSPLMILNGGCKSGVPDESDEQKAFSFIEDRT